MSAQDNNAVTIRTRLTLLNRVEATPISSAMRDANQLNPAIRVLPDNDLRSRTLTENDNQIATIGQPP